MTATITKPDKNIRMKSNKKSVEELIAAIRAIEPNLRKAILDKLDYRIEIGGYLIELKDVAGHGKWGTVLKEAGYDERTAQKLMRLPGSVIEQIRATDTDLAAKLPGDLWQLDALCALTLPQLRKAFQAGGWFFDGITRKQVTTCVKAIKAGKPPVNVTSNNDIIAEANHEVHDDVDTASPESKPHHGSPQHVARKPTERDDRDLPKGNGAVETVVVEGTDVAAVVGSEAKHHSASQADSTVVDVIANAAQTLVQQVTAAARDLVRGPDFKSHIEPYVTEDDLIEKVLAGLAEILNAKRDGKAA